MSMLKRYFLMLSICCCCVLQLDNANAKVCFVGDPACDAMSDFEAHADIGGTLKTKCEAAGYTDETCASGTYLSEYCPYSGDYFKCCGNDYAYSACTYPLVNVTVTKTVDGKTVTTPDKCGGRYRCKCDAVYKYASIDNCANGTPKYPNAYPGGESCTYVKGVSKEDKSSVYETAFKDCVCDRGRYPYPESECSKASATVANKDAYCKATLKDGDGNDTYYSACICDRKIYPYTNDACTYGGEDAGTDAYCVQAGTWFFKTCCLRCNNYPAEGTREGGPYDANVYRVQTPRDDNGNPPGYEVCPCVKGGTKYKIRRCNPGWAPNATGSACVPISCLNATKLFLAYNFGTYRLWTGGSALSKRSTVAGQSSNCSYTPGPDGNPVFTEVSNDNVTGKMPLLAQDLTATSLSSFNAYYSSKYVADSTTSTAACYAMLRNSCTANPTLTYGGNISATNNPTLTLNKINLHFSASVGVSRPLTVNYANVSSASGKTITFNNSVTLSGTGNTFTIDNTTINGAFSSTGFDYDIKNMNILNNNTVAANFTGSSTQKRTFTAEKFLVRGTAGFAYFNIYIETAYIGCTTTYTCSNATKNTEGHGNSIELYQSDYYMYDQATYKSRTVFMTTPAFLGARSNANSVNNSAGSRIIRKSSDIVAAMGLRSGHYNSEDDCDIGFTMKYADPRYMNLKSSVAGNCGNLYKVGCGHHSSRGDAVYRWQGDLNHATVEGGFADSSHGCKLCDGKNW